MKKIKPLVFDLGELKERANHGDGVSAYILGRSYFSEENGAVQDYEQAYKWYCYGAEVLNDPRCIYGKAICIDDGVGNVEQDSKQADKLFREAYISLKELSQRGELFSKFILGAYYFYGFAGVEQNNEKAFETIYSAAIDGHIAGIYDVGTFYHNGVGVEKNHKLAKQYLQLAADAGLKRANDKLKEWELDFDFPNKRKKKSF